MLSISQAPTFPLQNLQGETASISVTEAKSEHEASVVVEISKGKLIVTNCHLAEGQRERIKEEAEYSETETDGNKTNHQIFCLVQ